MKINLITETDLARENAPLYTVKAYFDEKKAKEFIEEYTTDQYKFNIVPMKISDCSFIYVIGYETKVRDFPAQTLGFSFSRDKIHTIFMELDELITAFRHVSGHKDFEVCRKNISEYFKSHGFEFVQDVFDQTLIDPQYIPTSIWCEIVKEV